MDGPFTRVTVVDLRIPFWRLVMFFVKAALAAIPAAIILTAISMVVAALISALIGGNPEFFRRWTL